MKMHLIICLTISVFATSAFASTSEKRLILGNHLSPPIGMNQGIAEQITAYAESANFHSGKMGGMDLSPLVTQNRYRDCIMSGRFIVVRFEKPHFLTIVGNRERRDLFVYEIIVGFTEDWFPMTPFILTSESELLELHKVRGDFGLPIQKAIVAETKGEAGTGQPATQSRHAKE